MVMECGGTGRLAGCRALVLVTAFGMLCAPAAAEPTSKALWAQPTPPFCFPRPEHAISDRAKFVDLPGAWVVGRYATPGQTVQVHEQAAVQTTLPEDLQAIAPHVGRFYRDRGFREPVLAVAEGCYRVLLIGPAVENGFYARGREDSTELRGKDDQYVFVSEPGAVEQVPHFRHKAALTFAHELFHAIQRSYGSLTPGYTGDYRHWVHEGLSSALGLAAVRGQRFMGGAPLRDANSFVSGHRYFAMPLGMRPYDVALDVGPSEDVTRMPVAPHARTNAERNVLARYMTASFWNFLFEHGAPRGRDNWHLLPGLMPQPGADTDAGSDDATAAMRRLLRWADDVARRVHPPGMIATGQPMSGYRGLYDAYPDFIAKRVLAPFQVYKTNKGELQWDRWLTHMFPHPVPGATDSCQVYRLDEQTPAITLRGLVISRLASRCIRLLWAGHKDPQVGAPVASLVVTSSGGADADLDAIRVGHHGVVAGAMGRLPSRAGAYTSAPLLGWGIDLNPVPGTPGPGAVAVTFSNVARDPLKTRSQAIDITISVSTVQVSGQVTRPASGDEPASTGKASGKPRTRSIGIPVVIAPGAKMDVSAGEPWEQAAQGHTCWLQVAQQTHRAGMQIFVRNQDADDQPAAGPPRPSATGGMPPSCTVMQARRGAAANDLAGRLTATLQLPQVPEGAQGAVRGATVRAQWLHAGPQGEEEISAETDLVNVAIAESTATYVRGGWSARFVLAQHGVEGALTGEFHIDRVLEGFTPAHPADAVSSDARLQFGVAASATGMNAVAIPDSAGAGAVALANDDGVCRLQRGSGPHTCTQMEGRMQCHVDFTLQSLPAAMRGQARDAILAAMRGMPAAEREAQLQQMAPIWTQAGFACVR